jgi:hypothetical protein
MNNALVAMILCSCVMFAADAAAGDAGIDRLNSYRAAEKLTPVTENQLISVGDFNHSRYIVKTYTQAIKAGSPLGGDEIHSEGLKSQWYSYQGFVAAKSSDVLYVAGDVSPAWAVDSWIDVPFHRLPLLNPHLSRIGYGSFCEGGICAAALNTDTGALSLTMEVNRQMWSGVPLTGSDEAMGGGVRYRSPIEFPADGSVTELRELLPEWPDPLSACAGYQAPAGLPITLQLGMWLTPKVSAWSLASNGVAVEACAFDAFSYKNPDSSTQEDGRGVLKDYGAVVLVPRAPLVPGRTYNLSMTVDNQKYDWSFSVAQAK